MTARRLLHRAAAASVAAALIAGCGQSTLTAGQLHADAARICRAAQLQTTRIPTPTTAAGSGAFLRQGYAVIAPELAQLRRLRPPEDRAAAYATAIVNLNGELTALHAAIHGLRAGDDPVVAVRTLQERLAPIEQRGAAAWRAAGLPVCAGS